ncbi:MAG: flavodoxin-dependent (E)-4-hydroxy-3-methylbut-2-enyl-diphosphate synthase, partial [Oscillospiraceae bacterium]|nr:flavodoxin-dependent (E)-4-hydroxy-3-methylbut-2-enyl-diphosphate synthase [Oscillospiraceae bacterium]
MRHIKREVKIGNTAIGGNNPVLVQSMLNINSKDVEGNVQQAVELENAGCQLVRVSVPSIEDVRLVEAIKNRISIPLVADIHFDYKVALACADAGIDKIRINPGNIG